MKWNHRIEKKSRIGAASVFIQTTHSQSLSFHGTNATPHTTVLASICASVVANSWVNKKETSSPEAAEDWNSLHHYLIYILDHQQQQYMNARQWNFKMIKKERKEEHNKLICKRKVDMWI